MGALKFIKQPIPDTNYSRNANHNLYIKWNLFIKIIEGNDLEDYGVDFEVKAHEEIEEDCFL